MSNYIKSTDFSAKDSLITGDPNKIIKGSEINDEFNALQTAIATKSDLSSPTFLGNPAAPTQTAGNNTTRLATTAFVTLALQSLYPVGMIYTTVVATNPSTVFGFGTWVAFGAGRVVVGLDAADLLFDTVEETGGTKDSVVPTHTHTATVTDPGHTHVISRIFIESGGNAFDSGGGLVGTSVNTQSSVTGISVSNASTGVSGTNTNVQPYIVVYMWKRTA